MRSCPVYPLTLWDKLHGKQRPRRGSYFAKLLFVKGSKKTTLLLSFIVLLLFSEKKGWEQEPTLSVCCWVEAFTFGVRFDPSNRSDSPSVFVHTIGCLSSSFSLPCRCRFPFFFVMSSGGGDLYRLAQTPFACLGFIRPFFLLSNLFALIVTPVV